jgi:hypothetical protein
LSGLRQCICWSRMESNLLGKRPNRYEPAGGNVNNERRGSTETLRPHGIVEVSYKAANESCSREEVIFTRKISE